MKTNSERFGKGRKDDNLSRRVESSNVFDVLDDESTLGGETMSRVDSLDAFELLRIDVREFDAFEWKWRSSDARL